MKAPVTSSATTLDEELARDPNAPADAFGPLDGGTDGASDADVADAK